MLLNDLHDDCLREIFQYLDDMDDLFRCYVCCQRWRLLILERTRKAKYLLGKQPDFSQNYDPEFVYYRPEGLSREGIYLRRLYPNLRVIDVEELLLKMNWGFITNTVASIKELKGLINTTKKHDRPISKFYKNLEMISSSHLETAMKEEGAKVKQLDLINYCLSVPHTLGDFKESIHFFPNLERLRVFHNEVGKLHRGPRFKKMKILELYVTANNSRESFFGLHFMDYCPNLQSAHIMFDCNQICCDLSVINENLQDLVLDFRYNYYQELGSWKEILNLLSKYPNIKHLAIRRNRCARNRYMVRLIKMLPQLVLLDLRGSKRITRRGAKKVQHYCERKNRTVKFYYKPGNEQIKRDWPELSDFRCKVSLGFDFMKNCFLKDFANLSFLLDPMDT